MKKYLSFFVAGATLCCGWGAQAQLVTALAVVVNDSVITMGEIERVVEDSAKTVALRYPNDQAGFTREMSKLRDETIESMVEDKLVLREFMTSGYATNVLEAFVDDSIRDIIKAKYYGDRARLVRSLREQGLTYEDYRRQQRELFIIRYMNYQNSSNPRKIFISPLKVEQYYQGHNAEFKLEDQVKLRMIVLPQPAGGAPGCEKKLAEEILAKIDAGVPFAEMASVYSAGSQRAEGGDRGWVDRTYFKADLARAAFELKPGQHTGVIEQPEACYLMKVDDVKPAHVRSLSEVRGDIERTLRNEENLRLHKLWIDRLKRKTKVIYY